jgi:hypothetical protein
MLLAEPLFACVVGVAAVALVVVTAPLWTALASQLSQWLIGLFTKAGRNVDESIYGDDSATDSTHKDDERKP